MTDGLEGGVQGLFSVVQKLGVGFRDLTRELIVLPWGQRRLGIYDGHLDKSGSFFDLSDLIREGNGIPELTCNTVILH